MDDNLCPLSDEDDEILANFPMSDEDIDVEDDEEKENNLEPITNVKTEVENPESNESDNDVDDDVTVDQSINYDSADEVLEKLMAKEKELEKEKEITAHNNSKRKKSIKTIDDSEDDEDEEDSGVDVDEETAAEIAALEAKLAALKSKKTPKKKEKNIDKPLPKDTNTTDICKHNKKLNQCFFCNTSQTPTTNSSKVVFKDTSPKHLEAVVKKLHEPTKVNQSSTTTQKKQRVAHQPKVETEKQSPTSAAKKNFYSTKKDAKPNINDIKIKQEPSNVEKSKKKDTNTYVFANISISNPKVGSLVLEERMKARRLVQISKVATTMRNNDIEGDWVTVGVLVKKCAQKTASNGKTYSVWELSDLGNGTENQTVGFFLFGEVYKQHWKMQAGTVLGLLNPTIMKQDKDQGVSLSLDNPRKLMEIGTAKALGVCKGIRKSDGRQCTMYINLQFGEYCEYHLQRAFKKAKSGRMELSSGGKVPQQKGRGNLMRNIKKDISSGEVHYGGSTVFRPEVRTKKDNVKLSGKNNKPSSLRDVMKNDLKLQADRDLKDIKIKRENDKLLQGGTEEFKQLLVKPTVGSRNLMHMLHGDQEKEEEAKVPKKDYKSGRSFLKSNKKELLSTSTPPPQESQRKRKLTDLNFFEDTQTQNTQEQKKIKTSPLLQNKENRPKNNSSINKSSSSERLKYSASSKKPPSTSCTNTSTSRKSPPVSCTKSKPTELAPKLGRGFSSKSKDIVFSDDEEDYLSYNKYTGEEGHTRDSSVMCNSKCLADELEKKRPVKRESVDSIKAKENGTSQDVDVQNQRRAIAVVQAQGSIQSDDPNAIQGHKKKKLSLEKIEEKVKKSQVPITEDDDVRQKKRKSLLAGVLGNFDVGSDAYKKLINQKSRNAGAVRLVRTFCDDPWETDAFQDVDVKFQAEQEKEDRYFDSLEKKEKMEEKLTSIFEIKVKAKACKECDYMAESQSNLCKERNHTCMTLPRVVKRFFACKECGWRTHTYQKPYPTTACQKCSSMNYAKAPMAYERKGPKIGAETLELRGKEQKFVNSLA